MIIAKNKGYKYYACYKNGHNGGAICHARDSCEEAYKDLKRFEIYVQNDLIFIGVVKCKDGRPLDHIQDIG